MTHPPMAADTLWSVPIDHPALRRVLDDLGLVPLPGAGATRARFRALRETAATDLAMARLVEGHLDAVAILAEAGRGKPDGLWGVWAADPPDGRVAAAPVDGGWQLTGTKRWCSGARTVDHALFTAHADDGYRLFAVPLDAAGVQVRQGTWHAVGMRRSDTLDVGLDDVVLPRDAAVGPAEWYLCRRGFWIGGIGVAACWYGGAVGALRALRRAVAGHDDPHGLAHLGAADALCAAMGAMLREAADSIDEGTEGPRLRLLAWRVRASVEQLALDALRHAERGVGAGGLTADPAMARRAADLPVYVRQHRGQRDLEALGRLTLEVTVS